MSTENDPPLPVDLTDGKVGNKEYDEESTEEVLEKMLARNPEKHSTTAEERARRAVAARRSELNDASLDEANTIYERRVRECGGDPDATMGGNRPRWTMDEDQTVYDHETKQKYKLDQPEG